MLNDILYALTLHLYHSQVSSPGGFYEWMNSGFCGIVCCQERRHKWWWTWIFFNYSSITWKNGFIARYTKIWSRMTKEIELSQQFKELDLSDEQRKIIIQWTDAIQAQESAYTAVGSGWVYNAIFPCWWNLQTYKNKKKISGISWLFKDLKYRCYRVLFRCERNFLPLYTPWWVLL